MSFNENKLKYKIFYCRKDVNTFIFYMTNVTDKVAHQCVCVCVVHEKFGT